MTEGILGGLRIRKKGEKIEESQVGRGNPDTPVEPKKLTQTELKGVIIPPSSIAHTSTPKTEQHLVDAREKVLINFGQGEIPTESTTSDPADRLNDLERELQRTSFLNILKRRKLSKEINTLRELVINEEPFVKETVVPVQSVEQIEARLAEIRRQLDLLDRLSRK